jgi:hypothetical protein
LAIKAGLLVARTPIVALTGVAAVVVATVVYAYEQRSMAIATQGSVGYLDLIAALYLMVMTAGVMVVILDLRRIVAERIAVVQTQGFAPTSPTWLLPYVLSIRKYRWYFVASTVLYGLFYAIITNVIVFQPSVDFGGLPGVAVPSLVLTPCCGAPLYTPVVAVYLASHVGLLVIPLTIILLIAISALVGLNLSIAVFAFDSRAKGNVKGLAGVVGAVVGLFTGCPTCAGLFFANTLGGPGVTSFATLLGYYQPAFMLLSLPVLLVTPYLTSRSLSRVFRDGCVYLKSDGVSRTSR